MPEPSPDPLDPAPSRRRAGVNVLDAAGPRRRSWSRSAATKKLGIVGWLAIGWIAAIVLSALFAPLLPIPKPDQKFIVLAGDGPSFAHPFGLDSIGQDMFARVIYGARASLLISVASVLFGLIGRRRARPHRRLLPRQDRHGPELRVQHVPGHPAAGAGARHRRRVRQRAHGHRRQARVLAGHLDRHRVDPDHRAHHRAPARWRGRSASSCSRPGAWGPRTAASSSARCCPTCCRRCSRSRCSASPW